MTAAMMAGFLLLLTAVLLVEEWCWQRRVARLAARRAVPTMRCLVCDITVDDFRTHSRLRHGARAASIEDSPEWAS